MTAAIKATTTVHYQCHNPSCTSVADIDKRCKECWKVHYCSTKCERIHWEDHRKVCVASDDKFLSDFCLNHIRADRSLELLKKIPPSKPSFLYVVINEQEVHCRPYYFYQPESENQIASVANANVGLPLSDKAIEKLAGLKEQIRAKKGPLVLCERLIDKASTFSIFTLVEVTSFSSKIPEVLPPKLKNENKEPLISPKSKADSKEPLVSKIPVAEQILIIADAIILLESLDSEDSGPADFKRICNIFKRYDVLKPTKKFEKKKFIEELLKKGNNLLQNNRILYSMVNPKNGETALRAVFREMSELVEMRKIYIPVP